MDTTVIFFTFSKEFCYPSKIKGIISDKGRDLRFAAYVHHYKILPGNVCGFIMKIQDGRHGLFFVSAMFTDFPVTYSRAKSVKDIVLKFARYFHPYTSLSVNIFGLILKQGGYHGCFLNGNQRFLHILRFFSRLWKVECLHA